MHETQQPRDPKKTTGIVYAVILVVLLLLNFWAFPAMMKGQVKQVDYGTFLNMLEGGELSTVEIQDQQIYFVDKNGEGVSELYGISDFSAHTTVNIRKGYLIGKYGATPNIEIEEL